MGGNRHSLSGGPEPINALLVLELLAYLGRTVRC
jgi:hypothetical protein